jgi:competence protein ComEC
LGAAAFYLALSGAEVATQRAFIMIAIVLIGVMIDRPTLTFRTLTVAAFGVLLLAPEAIIHPSFQMSFAAISRSLCDQWLGWPQKAIGYRLATSRGRVAGIPK